MSRIELDDLDQDAPFLDVDERPDEPIPASSPGPSLARRTSPWQVSSPRAIVLLVAAAKFCIVTSGMLMLMPLYRLIEDAFCHVHYEDDSPGLIDEMKCKVDGVQVPLGYLMGWVGLVNSVLNLIATYPYGMLADRIGRKPIVLLSYGGLATSFMLAPFLLGPARYTLRRHPYILLPGSLWTLIGGGLPVLLNTLYAIAADVSAEADKATHFLYLTMGTTAGGLLGPLVSGLLMEAFGPWVPIAISVCTIPMVFIFFIFMPETLTVSIKTQGTGYQPPLAAVRNHIAHGLKDLNYSLRMLKNINIRLCLVTFFFGNARHVGDSTTLMQYISKHFGWTLAETTILLSPLGIVHLVVLGCLPKLSGVLLSPRFGFVTFGKDLFLAQISMFIITFSALMRAFSSSIAPFLVSLFIGSFGAAEGPLVRATVTSFVEPSYTSRLYALVGMAEVLGSVAGGPVLAWCFDRGLQLKGVWVGLPWFYLTLVCVLSLVALLFVRPPKKNWDDNDVFGDCEEGDDVRPSNPVRLD